MILYRKRVNALRIQPLFDRKHRTANQPCQNETLIAELAERSPIIIQNCSNPSSRKKFGRATVRPYDRTTVRPTVQGATFSMRGQLYHGHYLIISPLHGYGEVANESPLILPRTLSIVGALVLLKRRAGKKMRAPLLGTPNSIY